MEIDSVDFKLIEASEYTVTLSWKAVISNHMLLPVAFNLEIQFLDSDDFELSSDLTLGVVIRAGDTKTIQDTVYVNTSVANQIAQIIAGISGIEFLK